MSICSDIIWRPQSNNVVFTHVSLHGGKHDIPNAIRCFNKKKKEGKPTVFCCSLFHRNLCDEQFLQTSTTNLPAFRDVSGFNHHVMPWSGHFVIATLWLSLYIDVFVGRIRMKLLGEVVKLVVAL